MHVFDGKKTEFHLFNFPIFGYCPWKYIQDVYPPFPGGDNDAVLSVLSGTRIHTGVHSKKGCLQETAVHSHVLNLLAI